MSAPHEFAVEFEHKLIPSLAFVNRAAANMHVQISLLYADFHSFSLYTGMV
jgi:hypothetical protein